MDEGVGRAAGIVARTFGNVVNPVVTALMTFAGVVTGRPDVAGLSIPTGALAGAVGEEAVLAAFRAWTADGVEQLAEAIEEEAGEPIEEMMRGLRTDRKSSRLLGETVNVAAHNTDEWTVRALARAYVAGVKDPAKVDPMLDLVRVLPGVEGKHARVMAVLAKPPHVQTVDAVAVADPGLGHTVAILARDLERLGLVAVERNVVSLAPVGWSCAALLDELGSLPEKQRPAESS
jgi:hypothetical protein